MANTSINALVKEPLCVRDPEAFANSMTAQLRMAGLVQRDFLPDHLPNTDRLNWATRFYPAEWVSGDIYDVVRLDERHIGFYIADVVGHGMPAALLTIFVKQAMALRQTTTNSYSIFSPAEVMKNLNRKMTSQKLSAQQFVTCCYCLLNTETLQLTYCRAGHPYPLLLRANQPIEQLESRGSLLGIFEHPVFDQATIPLLPGDKLLLYSDGAEPLISYFGEHSGFQFTEEFSQLKGMKIEPMLNKIDELIGCLGNSSSELDDITVVGLEVL